LGIFDAFWAFWAFWLRLVGCLCISNFNNNSPYTIAVWLGRRLIWPKNGGVGNGQIDDDVGQNARKKKKKKLTKKVWKTVIIESICPHYEPLQLSWLD
jgi:hypothetical protein